MLHSLVFIYLIVESMYIKFSQQFVVPQKSQYFFWIKLWLVVFEMSSIRQFQTHRQINEEKNKDHIHFTPHNTISSSKSSTSVIYRPVSLINVIDTSSSYDLLTECDMASLSWCKLMGIYISFLLADKWRHPLLLCKWCYLIFHRIENGWVLYSA